MEIDFDETSDCANSESEWNILLQSGLAQDIREGISGLRTGPEIAANARRAAPARNHNFSLAQERTSRFTSWFGAHNRRLPAARDPESQLINLSHGSATVPSN